MSHEIRTPMNGVLGMTALVLDSELAPEQREYLEMAKSSAEHLLTVINDILDFSKIEAGEIDLDPAEFVIRDAMETTCKTLTMRARQKGIDLRCQVAAEVPDRVVGDQHRLAQVLVNLVGNAMKFTEVGHVSLRVTVVPGDAGKTSLRSRTRASASRTRTRRASSSHSARPTGRRRAGTAGPGSG